MPTYTVLGGTGSTGSSVINHLLEKPPPHLTLRIYVRSKPKLLALIPELQQEQSRTSTLSLPETSRRNPNIEIVEGTLTNEAALAKCLQGSEAIFSCIATNDSIPGTTVAVDSTAAIIGALRTARDGAASSPSLSSASGSAKGGYRKPVVVMLSSSSINPHLRGHAPAPIRFLLHRALHYVYTDLAKSEAMFEKCREEDAGLLDCVFAQPPAVLPGKVATGYELSTEVMGRTISFADLGRGMVEMAERREEFGWKGVSLVAMGNVGADWRGNIRNLGLGMTAYLFPWIWTRGWL